jgi:hypothetical protein
MFKLFCKNRLEIGKTYLVASDHPFHANKRGTLQFMGGPKRDVAILCPPDELCNYIEAQRLFAVKPESLTISRDS